MAAGRALLALGLAAAALGSGCAGAPHTAPETGPEARALLERAIEAQGGQDAIGSIATLREVAEVEYRGNQLRVTIWLQRPDKLRQIIIRDGVEQHSILDGERAWAVIKSPGREPVVTALPAGGVAQLQELRKNWVPVLGAEAESLTLPSDKVGAPALLATDQRGRSRTLLFHPETGLLTTIRAGTDAELVEYRHSDYRLVRSLGGGGIQWPHAVDVSVNGTVTKRIRTVSIELDPELPPNAFRP